MKRIFSVIILASLLTASVLKAQNANEPFEAGKRYSVIIDNDFCGDPDGLFQLVHHVLSTSCDIKGIIGAHHNGFSFFRDLQGKDDAEKSVNKVNEALELMGLKDQLKVVPGAAEKMTDPKQPIVSEGARLIVEEALKATPEKPLYVCVGGPLTDIASAWLMNPEIGKNIILIWIGGQEYKETGAIVPPGYSMPEYNLNLSIAAAQVVFNKSDMRIWQIPRDVYRQCMYSMTELEVKVRPFEKLGAYLYDSLANLMKQFGARGSMGETYILGDSPLVLMTALMSNFETDPASSHYQYVTIPTIADDGSYRYNHGGRQIRVYDRIDTRLMFADMEAKLQLFANKRP
ncbi:MAG: nucleoside hydrolase [Bacteroidaceae bacterium]|nr:nucleoside hydrolase [Bacteroidaceae bacterium]